MAGQWGISYLEILTKKLLRDINNSQQILMKNMDEEQTKLDEMWVISLYLKS